MSIHPAHEIDDGSGRTHAPSTPAGRDRTTSGAGTMRFGHASAAPDPQAVAPDEDGRDVTRSHGQRVRWMLRRNPVFWVGAVLAGMVIGVAVLAPVLAPHDPLTEFRRLMPLDGSALPPSPMFPLGTDVAGRDYLSRTLYGASTTLAVGLISSFLATALGLLVGVVAAYAGVVRIGGIRGRSIGIPVEDLLMRLTDVALAFPVLLLAIALAQAVGPSVGLVILVITTVLWSSVARIVYGRARVLVQAEFVEAAHAVGSSGTRIVRRHLLPFLVPLALVYGALGIGTAVVFEATLTYLGVGVPPPTPTWGSMIAQNLGWYRQDPRLLLVPSLAIMVTVLAFTLLGDALRDALDPRAGPAA